MLSPYHIATQGIRSKNKVIAVQGFKFIIVKTGNRSGGPVNSTRLSPPGRKLRLRVADKYNWWDHEIDVKENHTKVTAKLLKETAHNPVKYAHAKFIKSELDTKIEVTAKFCKNDK